MQLTIILTVLPIAAALILHFIFWQDDVRAEKYYKESFQNIKESGYFQKSKRVRPIVIVDSGNKISKIRVFFRKLLAKIFSRGKVQILCVFGKDSEEERNSFIIQQAFASEWELIEILDITFIESAINYFAYKFATEKRKFDNKTVYLLRKDFESSKYKDCITKLDDLDFSEKVVVNPPPQKKPLLRELIMPMVLDQNDRINDMSFQQKEEMKSLFMKICESMHMTTCGILFIGGMLSNEYIGLLSENAADFKSFLLCATGNKTGQLEYIIMKINDWVQNNRYVRHSISGNFQYKDIENCEYRRVFVEILT